MGKVVLFAVLTMDGCLTDSSAEAKQWLADADMTDRFGITEMKETAHILDENTPLTLLSDWVKDSPSHSVYFIEANATTAGIINGMMRYRQVDEIRCSRFRCVSHELLPDGCTGDHGAGSIILSYK